MNRNKLGRYEIQSEIGRGAMGVIYRAHDPVLDRTVAVKTIGLSQDERERAEYEARFYQEAKAAGGLNHPNIVTVHDVGDSENVAYMAMEYLEGGELGELIGAGRIMPIDKAIDIAAQVADGLAYAHARGVIHRDIKPPNIMVLPNGMAKIMDFGIARMRHSQVTTHTGMVLGSPRYMSPEVVVGQRADGRSDIFSLGIILYEMLTGNAPFAGESLSALMFQTINFVPPAPSAVNAAVPPMLDFIIAKMLAKKREQRYQDAGELAKDLRDCLAQPRQAAGGARPDPAQPPALRPVPSLLDAQARMQLLAGAAQLTRATDVEKDETATAPTLGISRRFDSAEATQRLAAETGMTQEFARFAATMMPSSGAYHMPSAPPILPAPAQANPDRRQWRILLLGLAMAVLIAALINIA